MGLPLSARLLPVALMLWACAAVSPMSTSRCDVADMNEVLGDPLAHAGRVYCGDVFAVEYGQTARLLGRAEDMPPSNDVALLVTTRTRRALEGLSPSPQRFYVEALIDPQRPCFIPSGSGEECVPYRRPISVHIRTARRIAER